MISVIRVGEDNRLDLQCLDWLSMRGLTADSRSGIRHAITGERTTQTANGLLLINSPKGRFGMAWRKAQESGKKSSATDCSGMSRVGEQNQMGALRSSRTYSKLCHRGR